MRAAIAREENFINNEDTYSPFNNIKMLYYVLKYIILLNGE